MSNRRRAKKQSHIVVDGSPVPAELLSLDVEVWTEQAAFLGYMRERGWHLPPKERMGVAASPAQRRQSAAAEWAMENGVTSGAFPDWHRLRELGVLG